MRIYGILLKIKRQVFKSPKMADQPSAGRPSQKSVDRCTQTCTTWVNRPHGLPSEGLCSMEMVQVDRAVDR